MNIRNRIFFVLLFLPALNILAQNKITDKLQSNVSGQGSVKIYQDSKITSLIGNIYSNIVATSPSGSNNISSTTASNGIRNEHVSSVSKDHKIIKAKGYRVQVYAGNNSRQAKTEAMNIATQVKNEFPDLPVYTYFIPPRWLCRVGDYINIEEANAVLHQLKRTGLFKEASIVKEQINIPID